MLNMKRYIKPITKVAGVDAKANMLSGSETPRWAGSKKMESCLNDDREDSFWSNGNSGYGE